MPSCASWLLSEPETDHINFAKLIARRHGLNPPIDILNVLRKHAQVEFIDWPDSCDAVVHGLTTQARPDVFVKPVPPHSARRLRFTLAHELGHIIIPWHLGSPHCDPSAGVGRSQSTMPGTPERTEAEADEFAGSILLPYADLWRQAERSDLQTLMNSLDEYELSPAATIMRLSRLLRPGFVFTGTFGEGWDKLLSPGTAAPVWTTSLSKHALESGKTEIAGKTIRWFRLASEEHVEPDQDLRSTTQILHDAIRNTCSGEDEAGLFHRLNGIVSGALSKPRFEDADQAFSHVEQWTRNNDKIPKRLRKSPDFDLYLRRKARERIERFRESAGK